MAVFLRLDVVSTTFQLHRNLASSYVQCTYAGNYPLSLSNVELDASPKSVLHRSSWISRTSSKTVCVWHAFLAILTYSNDYIQNANTAFLGKKTRPPLHTTSRLHVTRYPSFTRATRLVRSSVLDFSKNTLSLQGKVVTRVLEIQEKQGSETMTALQEQLPNVIMISSECAPTKKINNWGEGVRKVIDAVHCTTFEIVRNCQTSPSPSLLKVWSSVDLASPKLAMLTKVPDRGSG